jgi:sugar phosphate isomerase/epimerase
MMDRRGFLKASSAVMAASALRMRAETSLHLPLGLQLYSVRQQLAADFGGTLKELATIGYREVEAAGFFDRSAADVKGALDQAGLRCVSSHVKFAELYAQMDKVIEFHKMIGCTDIVCPAAMSKASAGAAKPPKGMTLDDWRWSAEQFNSFGKELKRAEIGFSYHNHVREFAKMEGTTPYDELLRVCEPGKVSFELDCGWAIVAGVQPTDYFAKYPGRFVMLHVKDFKLGTIGAGEDAKVTELGLGNIDYRPVFAAATKNQKIRHMFVEQEAFDMPWVDSLKTDAEYLRNLKA